MYRGDPATFLGFHARATARRSMSSHHTHALEMGAFLGRGMSRRYSMVLLLALSVASLMYIFFATSLAHGRLFGHGSNVATWSHFPFVADFEHDITLSITASPFDDPGTLEQVIPHLFRTSHVNGAHRRVVFDVRPTCEQPLCDADRFDVAGVQAVLDRLAAEGELDEIARVPYDLEIALPLYQKMFGDGMKDVNFWNGEGKGFWSYAYEVLSCRTKYLVHYDSDMYLTVHPPSVKASWVRMALAVLHDGDGDASKNEEVIVSVCPVKNCNYKNELIEQEVWRRGVTRLSRTWGTGRLNEFIDLGDFSTQVYAMDVQRFQSQFYPLPMEVSNWEACVSQLRKRPSVRNYVMLPFGSRVHIDSDKISRVQGGLSELITISNNMTCYGDIVDDETGALLTITDRGDDEH